jgi:uroporphyrin-III C-methyltransferase
VFLLESCDFFPRYRYNHTMTEANTPSQSNSTGVLLSSKKRSSGPSWPTVLVIVFLLAALVAASLAWFQQKRFENVSREIASQVQGLTSQVNDSQREAAQALGLAQAQSNRLTQLEQAHLETKNQLAALEQIWQGTSAATEDAMLANDIDRLLATANQQLRLSGNVNNAVITLEAALSALSRADRPRFAPLQRSISLDLDRLRAVPLIDVSILSKRLDQLSTLIARAPLVLPDAASPSLPSSQAPQTQSTPIASVDPKVALGTEPVPSNQASPSWWQAALNTGLAWSKVAAGVLGREIAELVSIQRVSDANALLMSPEQAALLRANLRTRVLTAQMALLMNQAPVWKSELTAIEQSLIARYDPKAPDTIAALRLVRELSEVQLTMRLPDISASFAALEALRSLESPPSSGGR